jgi:acyl carrier protein
VRELVAGLHPKLIDARLVRLDSDLDRDLARDSLSRVELLLRLNRRFKVQLSERLIGEADCPNDLVTAILAAVDTCGTISFAFPIDRRSPPASCFKKSLIENAFSSRRVRVATQGLINLGSRA